MISESKHFQAVIFDFGNVLCLPPTEQQFANGASLLGLKTPEFVAAFWKDRIEYDRGQASRTYWRSITDLAKLPLTDDLLNQLSAWEIDLWSNFDERVLAWVSQLRRNGFKTGILSNLPITLGEHLRTVPAFLNHFDHITFSYELHMVKPEPGIYHHAVEGLGFETSRILFLDDRLENVKGALDVGLPAYQFTTWERFVDEIAHLQLPAPTSE